MTDILQTISLLKQVISDENCARMNLSMVKGYLGELLVKAKLESEGLVVKHLGNQSGYDLLSGNFKIDVKFSALKNEVGGSGAYWGWALLHQNKKRGISCSHAVCVAVDGNYAVNSYYVIPESNFGYFPCGVGQFSKVKHAFLIGNERDLPEFNEGWRGLYEKSYDLLQQGKAKQVLSHESLREALAVTCLQ
jgi:hypothetical protein